MIVPYVPPWKRKWPNTGPPGLMPRASEQIPSPGALARIGHHSQGIGPNYGASGNAAINAAMARQAQTPQYDHTMGAGAGSPAKKKGLSLKNMINAMSKMKAPTGEDFSRVSGRAGGPRPTAPSPRALGVDALEMASADDPRKKWWKQWQGLMGA